MCSIIKINDANYETTEARGVFRTVAIRYATVIFIQVQIHNVRVKSLLPRLFVIFSFHFLDHLDYFLFSWFLANNLY